MFFGRENSCYGGEKGCFGGENSCYGGENSCFGRENSCYGRENSCFGRENSCYGRENGKFGVNNNCFASKTSSTAMVTMLGLRKELLAYDGSRFLIEVNLLSNPIPIKFIYIKIGARKIISICSFFDYSNSYDKFEDRQ